MGHFLIDRTRTLTMIEWCLTVQTRKVRPCQERTVRVLVGLSLVCRTWEEENIKQLILSWFPRRWNELSVFLWWRDERRWVKGLLFWKRKKNWLNLSNNGVFLPSMGTSRIKRHGFPNHLQSESVVPACMELKTKNISNCVFHQICVSVLGFLFIVVHSCTLWIFGSLSLFSDR